METTNVKLVALCALSLAAGGCSNKADTGSNGDGDGGTSSMMSCTTDTVRAKRRLRRLTRFEFDNTVSDLLGVQSSYGQGFPPDDVVSGFDNNSAALRVGPLLADKLLSASEGLAEAAAKNLATLAPCAATSMNDDCAKTLISSLGKRAFRRPTTQTEQDRYFALYSTIAKTDGFTEGAKAIIEAMLQSPNFLYRTELGAGAAAGNVPLTDYELASELSYLFWSSMPDDELLAAAEAGTLHTPDALAAQARRLLASAKSRPMLDHFATQWLALDQINQVTKDPKYTDFTPDIRASMMSETLDLFDHVVHGSGGKLPELFTTKDSYVSPALAAFYGLMGQPADKLPDGNGRYDVSSVHRGGVLTHASILASQAKPDSASPVHRGKLVREKFLCGQLPPPPAGLNLQLAPVDPSLSNRDRFTMHTSNPACSGCHVLIDPIGFGFEHWDAVGRWQDKDNGHPIDDSGTIVGTLYTTGAFQGVLDLEQKLAASQDVSSCFALQWVRYGYGVAEGQDTACLIDRATRAFNDSGLTIAELLVALVQAPDFRLRLPESDMPASMPDMSAGPVNDAGMAIADLAVAAPDLIMTTVSASVHEDSRWQTGYCDGVMVTNNGNAAVEWSVTLPVDGMIYNLWNAAQAPAGGKLIKFTGLDYDHTLMPGATVTFGWCANTM